MVESRPPVASWSDAGFTLPEILAAIALAAIVGATATPVATKMARRAKAFGALAEIRQVLAVARMQAIRRGVNVVVTVSRSSDGRILLHTFQDRANDATAPLPADEQAAAGNARQDTGGFATSPATDEPTLSDVSLDTGIRLWKQGSIADDTTEAVRFDTYGGDPSLEDRVVFLPSGGIVPPQDPASGPPTPSSGRGIYFADVSGKNFFRLTVDADLTGRIRSDKYQEGSGYVPSGWTWQ